MAKQNQTLDLVFQALSDPIRRDVLDRLQSGPASLGDLADGHGISLPSFSRHIGVLEDAGLIATEKKGRVRMCRLVPKRLQVLDDYLAGYRGMFAAKPVGYGKLAKSLYGADKRSS
ncbi:ArsR/SmtB family transcription factor [Pseudooceanicola sp. MF1-13]|uniref:ArsR/SmtB family transcription factor n=1 Tax=Pseudooceanicola sp. MF1-13 TaxID=3379095 RepID=UPI003892A811